LPINSQPLQKKNLTGLWGRPTEQILMNLSFREPAIRGSVRYEIEAQIPVIHILNQIFHQNKIFQSLAGIEQSHTGAVKFERRYRVDHLVKCGDSGILSEHHNVSALGVLAREYLTRKNLPVKVELSVSIIIPFGPRPFYKKLIINRRIFDDLRKFAENIIGVCLRSNNLN
jgi:hypothetical protein